MLPTIGPLMWTNLVVQDLVGLVDNVTLKLAIVDLVFISTNSGKSSK